MLHMDQTFGLEYGDAEIHVNDIWSFTCGHLIDLHCLQKYLRAWAFISLVPGRPRIWPPFRCTLRTWKCPEQTCTSTFGTVCVGMTLWIFDPRDVPLIAKSRCQVVSNGNIMDSHFAHIDVAHLLSCVLYLPGNLSSVSSNDCDAFTPEPISTTYIGPPGPPPLAL